MGLCSEYCPEICTFCYWAEDGCSNQFFNCSNDHGLQTVECPGNQVFFFRTEDQIEGNVTEIPGYWECGLNKSCGLYEEYCDTYTTKFSTESANTTTAQISTFSTTKPATTALFPDSSSKIPAQRSTTADSLLSSTASFTTSFAIPSTLNPILPSTLHTASTSPLTAFPDTTASQLSTKSDYETAKEATTTIFFWESTMSEAEILSTFSLSTAEPTADYSATTAETSTTATGWTTTTGLLEAESTTTKSPTTAKTNFISSSLPAIVSTLSLTTGSLSQSSTETSLADDPPSIAKSLVAVVIPTIMFLVAVAVLCVMFGNRKASEIKPIKKFAQDEPGSTYDKWDHEMAPGHVNPSYYNPNFLLPTVAAQIDEQTGPSSIIDDVAGSAQLSAVKLEFDRSSISSDTELNDNRSSTRASTTYDMDV